MVALVIGALGARDSWASGAAIRDLELKEKAEASAPAQYGQGEKRTSRKNKGSHREGSPHLAESSRYRRGYRHIFIYFSGLSTPSHHMYILHYP